MGGNGEQKKDKKDKKKKKNNAKIRIAELRGLLPNDLKTLRISMVIYTQTLAGSGEPFVLILQKADKPWTFAGVGNWVDFFQIPNASISEEDIQQAIKRLKSQKDITADMLAACAADICLRRELPEETQLTISRDCEEPRLVAKIPLPKGLKHVGHRFIFAAKLIGEPKPHTVKISKEHFGKPLWLPISALQATLGLLANVSDPERLSHYGHVASHFLEYANRTGIWTREMALKKLKRDFG